MGRRADSMDTYYPPRASLLAPLSPSAAGQRIMAYAASSIRGSLKFVSHGAKAFHKNYLSGYLNSSAMCPIYKKMVGLSSSVRRQHLAHGSNLTVRASKKFSSTNGSFKVPEERVTVLVIGGGGREHALFYALERSPSSDAVFCAPVNSSIAQSGDATCIPDLDISSSEAIISFCRKWGVGLVVVGPEAPLVAGLANDLVKAGIPTFGPS